MRGAQGNGHDVVIEVSGLVGWSGLARLHIGNCHGESVRRFAYVNNSTRPTRVEFCVVRCVVTPKALEHPEGGADCAQFCAHHQTLPAVTDRRTIAEKPCWTRYL